MTVESKDIRELRQHERSGKLPRGWRDESVWFCRHTSCAVGKAVHLRKLAQTCRHPRQGGRAVRRWWAACGAIAVWTPGPLL
jgi:hypothetical protein